MEDVLYFLILFCRTFNIWHLFLLAKHGYFLFRYSSVVCQIRLIPNQNQHRIFLCVLFNFSTPKFAHIYEALLIRQIKNHEDCLTTSIISTRDSPEALLSGCIPNLKFHILIVNSCGLKSEVNSNGGEVMLLKLIFSESNKNWWLADSRIANDDCFVQVVKLFYHFVSRLLTPFLIILYVWFSIKTVER